MKKETWKMLLAKNEERGIKIPHSFEILTLAKTLRIARGQDMGYKATPFFLAHSG